MLIEGAGERTEQEARQMEFFPSKITYALSQIIKKKAGMWKHFILRTKQHSALDKRWAAFFSLWFTKVTVFLNSAAELLRSCRSDVNDAVCRSNFLANALKFNTAATAQRWLSEPTKKTSKLWHLQHSRLIKCHANEGCETEGGEAAAKLWPWMRKQQGLGTAIIKQLNGLFHLQLWWPPTGITVWIMTSINVCSKQLRNGGSGPRRSPLHEVGKIITLFIQVTVIWQTRVFRIKQWRSTAREGKKQKIIVLCYYL